MNLRRINLLLLITLFVSPSSFAEDSTQIAIDSIFKSGELDNYMKKNRQQNVEVVNSVDDKAIKESQQSLPKFQDGFQEFMGKIKYGNHNTVSADGEHVISLIRSVASQGQNQSKLLAEIGSYAKKGSPEAINFYGFVLEYGLFGATKNHAKAMDYFKIAANANYQPALYNLAINAAYNTKTNDALPLASTYLSKAYPIARDSSYRVCGFASFVAYRLNDPTTALRYANACGSALSSLPKAHYDEALPFYRRVALLRDSISTGVDDGYYVIEKLAKANDDNTYVYCKYSVLNKLRRKPDLAAVDMATRCYDAITNDRRDSFRRTQAIGSITVFVHSERESLKKLRDSNHFHYSWFVPYLPFGQEELNIFSPFMQVKK